MKLNKNKDSKGLFKSVFLAHFILILHLFLIAGLGFMVLFFRGIIFYMPWIMLGGTAITGASAYYLFKRMKKEGKSLKEMLSLPMFSGRNIEVSFLGGLASLKLEKPTDANAIETRLAPPQHRIEDATSMHVRELQELVSLLEKNLITSEEYNQAKRKLFNS